MIDVITSSVTAKEADSIHRLKEQEGFRALIRSMATDLAIAQVELAQAVSRQPAAFISAGTLPSDAKEAAIKAGDLQIALRVIDQQMEKNSEEFLTADIRVL
jgi:hypothetical protein